MPSHLDESHLRNTSPTAHPDNPANAPSLIVDALQQAWIVHRAAHFGTDQRTDDTAVEAFPGQTNYEPPHFLANLRHNCPAQRFVSKALDLKEQYITLDHITGLPGDALEAEGGNDYVLLAKAGTCKRCGHTAASPTGRIVLRSDRPPITGRVGR